MINCPARLENDPGRPLLPQHNYACTVGRLDSLAGKGVTGKGHAGNDAATGPVTTLRGPRSISMRGSSIGFVVLVLLAVAVAAFLLAPGSGRVDTSASSGSPVHWK
jgi:hypothetical protein